MVGLYPSIPHKEGILALKNGLKEQTPQRFLLVIWLSEQNLFSNTFFVEFNSEIKQHISGNAIETKFVPTYACIYIDKIETNFLKTQEVQSPVWLRYIDVIFFIFFIWTHGEAEL